MARHASLFFSLLAVFFCVAAQLHLHFTVCTFLGQCPRRQKKKFCFKMKDILPTGDTKSNAAEDAHVSHLPGHRLYRLCLVFQCEVLQDPDEARKTAHGLRCRETECRGAHAATHCRRHVFPGAVLREHRGADCGCPSGANRDRAGAS